MQYEITKPCSLLDENGKLAAAGWARSPVMNYNRENIKHGKDRIKEWHYYFCGDENYGIGLSMASMGEFHRLSCSFLDFKNNRQVNEMAFCPVSESCMEPPRTPYGEVQFKNDRAQGLYRCSNRQIEIQVKFGNFSDAEDLLLDLFLEVPAGDTLAHAFPFAGEEGLFFYCHKFPCIRVSGTVNLGAFSYTFDPDTAFGVQDWGRGVWPRYSNPYWGAATGIVDGKLFGFNIGYEYGDVKMASENALFYDGVIHKLTDVIFHIAENETAWKKTWTFTSPDKRFEIEMEPVLERSSTAPPGIQYGAEQHQVFGYFSGTAVLDDGKTLQLKRVFGFAEKVINHW